MSKALLVQPRHNYAPEQGQGHVYSPTSIWTIGSMLEAAGADVAYTDENLRSVDTSTANFIGVNLLGASYIPEVRNRYMQILSADQSLALGGQVISGLSADEFECMYPNENVIHGDNLTAIFQKLGLDTSKLQRPEKTSLISAYAKTTDEDMYEYMSREMSLYLGRGCKFNCDFCATERATPEYTRDLAIVEQDISYLVSRARSLHIDNLRFYLSNLDTVQSPDVIKEFATIIASSNTVNPDVQIQWRGLATLDCFVELVDEIDRRDVLEAMVESGFHTVGFGVDGGDDKTRQMVNKGHATDNNTIRAMEICNEYGITPEAIMVFGHPAETKKTLNTAVKLTTLLQEKYGAIPRPHIAKDVIPGNRYWNGKAKIFKQRPEYKKDCERRKKFLLNNPEYFQAMDFQALASSVSHSDPTLCAMVNEYYLKIVALTDDPDNYILPYAPEFSDEQIAQHKNWNTGHFDR